jgi:hypothetical protein
MEGPGHQRGSTKLRRVNSIHVLRRLSRPVVILEAIRQWYLLDGLYSLLHGRSVAEARRYRRFRLQTHSGSTGRPSFEELVSFLEWSVNQRRRH